MRFSDRPFAITDVETTGLDDVVHETIDIGLLIIDQHTLEIIDHFDTKVLPEHLETASPKALEINGYNPDDWQEAMSLREAMGIYSDYTTDAIFLGWNVTFDWGFIKQAFRDTGVPNRMNYHHRDIPSMGWRALRNVGLEDGSMDEVARHFGLPEEPRPHRAARGALAAHEILKQLFAEE